MPPKNPFTSNPNHLLVIRTPAAYKFVVPMYPRWGVFSAWPTASEFLRNRSFPLVISIREWAPFGWQDNSLDPELDEETCPIQYMKSAYRGHEVIEVPDNPKLTKSGKLSINV